MKILVGASLGSVILILIVATQLSGDDYDELIAAADAAYEREEFKKSASDYDNARKEVGEQDARYAAGHLGFQKSRLRYAAQNLAPLATGKGWDAKQFDDGLLAMNTYLHADDLEGKRIIEKWKLLGASQATLDVARNLLGRSKKLEDKGLKSARSKPQELSKLQSKATDLLTRLRAATESLQSLRAGDDLLPTQKKKWEKDRKKLLSGIQDEASRLDFYSTLCPIFSAKNVATSLLKKRAYQQALEKYKAAIRLYENGELDGLSGPELLKLSKISRDLAATMAAEKDLCEYLIQFNEHFANFDDEAANATIDKIEELPAIDTVDMVSKLRRRLDERKRETAAHTAFLAAESAATQEALDTFESFNRAIKEYVGFLKQATEKKWQGAEINTAGERIAELKSRRDANYTHMIDRANCFMSQGDFATAVQVLNNAIRFASHSPMAHVLKGESLTALSLLEQANDAFGRIVKIRAEIAGHGRDIKEGQLSNVEQFLLEHEDVSLIPQFFLELAKLRVLQGRFDDADTNLNKALAGISELEAPLLWGEAAEIRGDLHFSQERIEIAILDYRRGLELTHRDWALHIKLATALNRNGDYESSIDVCDDLFALSVSIPDSSVGESLFLKARNLCRLGALEDADQALRAALSWDFQHLKALLAAPTAQTAESHVALNVIIRQAQADEDLFAIRETPLMLSLRHIYLDFISRDMKLIAAGTFTQGDAESRNRAESSERRVTLDAFLLDAREVSNADYAEFLVAQSAGTTEDVLAGGVSGESHVPKFWEEPRWGESRPALPVVGVDLDDAEAFARYREKRLPTEAEWERAAKGPGMPGRRFPYGEEQLGSINIDDRGRGAPWEVDSPRLQFDVSQEGIEALSGNVSEWCQDFYDELIYSKDPGTVHNPLRGRSEREAIRGILTDCVVRGGSWNSKKIVARSSHRGHFAPSTRSKDIGFRCAFSIDPDLIGSLGQSLPLIELQSVNRPDAPEQDERPDCFGRAGENDDG